MKYVVTLAVLLALGGWASAADPSLKIGETGTTNGTNSVVITFEVENLPIGIGISAVTPVGELKVNGNVVNANTYTVSVMGNKGTITINAALQPGKADVVLKVNLSGGKPAVSATEEVVFKK